MNLVMAYGLVVLRFYEKDFTLNVERPFFVVMSVYFYLEILSVD